MVAGANRYWAVTFCDHATTPVALGLLFGKELSEIDGLIYRVVSLQSFGDQSLGSISVLFGIVLVELMILVVTQEGLACSAHIGGVP